MRTAEPLSDAEIATMEARAERWHANPDCNCWVCMYGRDIPRLASDLRAARTAAADLLERLAARGEWQPIETAPKERLGPAIYQNRGPDILLGADNSDWQAVGRWHWHQNGRTGNWKVAGRVPFIQPTHYRLLPPSPRSAP